MLRRVVAVAAAVAVLAVPASAAAAPSKNIVETAAAAPQFSTLVSLVKKAGLVDALSGKTKLTVFAPTDAAFEKVPEKTLDGLLEDRRALRKVLLYHVVAGKLLFRRGFNDGRTGASAKQERCGIAFRIASDQQDALALLRHHVGQVCECETLADAALSVNRDNLGFLRDGPGMNGGRRDRSFRAQRRGHGRRIHRQDLQFKIIFRQRGSSKAVR